MSVNYTYKDLPGFPSLQGILDDVFSGAIFSSGGLWGSIKNQFIVQIFFLINIFIFTITFFSSMTTLKVVFEEEMDELTSPFLSSRDL